MEARGGITAPQRYGKTWTVTHDPLMWREVADGFLADAGVRVLFHCLVVGVIMEDDRVLGIAVDSKAGRGAVHAKTVIDASGDGDVVYRAGMGFTAGLDGVVQNPTMIFRLGGVDVARFLEFWGPDTICSADVSKLLIEANASGRYVLPRAKIWIFPTPRPGELLVNATRVVGADGRELYPGDPEDLSEAEIMGRRQVRDYARFLADHIPGCAKSFVNDTGVQVGVRQTRSINGVERLTNDDVVARRKRPDGVVRSPWPIELHSGEKPKLEWIHDDYYEVPLNALLPEKGENLIAAGALPERRARGPGLGPGHRPSASATATPPASPPSPRSGVARGCATLPARNYAPFSTMTGRGYRSEGRN